MWGVYVFDVECQSTIKDAVPGENAAAMALKADLVFKRSESKYRTFASVL